MRPTIQAVLPSSMLAAAQDAVARFRVGGGYNGYWIDGLHLVASPEFHS